LYAHDLFSCLAKIRVTLDRRYRRRRLSSYSPEYHGPSRTRPDRPNRGRDRERDQDGDHYIPNYERDGYAPAPKYSQLPDNAPQYNYPGKYWANTGQQKYMFAIV
jgi:hypothetical protein